MTEDTPARRTVLDGRSLVPFGAVGSVILLLFGAKVWLDGQFNELRSTVGEIKYELRSIRESGSDRWTGSDMTLWVERLARSNPTLVIPQPR